MKVTGLFLFITTTTFGMMSTLLREWACADPLFLSSLCRHRIISKSHILINFICFVSQPVTVYHVITCFRKMSMFNIIQYMPRCVSVVTVRMSSVVFGSKLKWIPRGNPSRSGLSVRLGFLTNVRYVSSPSAGGCGHSGRSHWKIGTHSPLTRQARHAI